MSILNSLKFAFRRKKHDMDDIKKLWKNIEEKVLSNEEYAELWINKKNINKIAEGVKALRKEFAKKPITFEEKKALIAAHLQNLNHSEHQKEEIDEIFEQLVIHLQHIKTEESWMTKVDEEIDFLVEALDTISKSKTMGTAAYRGHTGTKPEDQAETRTNKPIKTDVLSFIHPSNRRRFLGIDYSQFKKRFGKYQITKKLLVVNDLEGFLEIKDASFVHPVVFDRCKTEKIHLTNVNMQNGLILRDVSLPFCRDYVKETDLGFNYDRGNIKGDIILEDIKSGDIGLLNIKVKGNIISRNNKTQNLWLNLAHKSKVDKINIHNSLHRDLKLNAKYVKKISSGSIAYVNCKEMELILNSVKTINISDCNVFYLDLTLSAGTVKLERLKLSAGFQIKLDNNATFEASGLEVDNYFPPSKNGKNKYQIGGYITSNSRDEDIMSKHVKIENSQFSNTLTLGGTHKISLFNVKIKASEDKSLPNELNEINTSDEWEVINCDITKCKLRLKKKMDFTGSKLSILNIPLTEDINCSLLCLNNTKIDVLKLNQVDKEIKIDLLDLRGAKINAVDIQKFIGETFDHKTGEWVKVNIIKSKIEIKKYRINNKTNVPDELIKLLTNSERIP